MRFLVLATMALTLGIIARTWSGPLSPSLAFWLVVCFGAELMWIRLPAGRATLSMASCAQFAAVLMLPGAQAMAVAAITGALAEAAVLRKPPLRVCFNAAQSALAVGAASWMFAVAGGSPGGLVALLAHAQFLPFILTAVAYFVINTVAVSLAVGMSDGVAPLEAWRRNFGHRYELLSSAALFSLGILLASHYSAEGLGSTLLLVFPVVIAHQGYQRVSERWADDDGRAEVPRAA